MSISFNIGGGGGQPMGGWGNAYQSAPDPLQLQQPPQGGGWLGALGNANYPTGPGGVPQSPGGMPGMGMTGQNWAQLGLGAAGGIADWFQQEKDRKEEKRRFDELMAERNRTRTSMGRSLSAAWGG